MARRNTETAPTTSVINEVMEAVIGLMNATSPFATVTRGALPTTEGIVCEIGPTIQDVLFWDKNTFIPLDVTINAKHPNMKTLSDTMNNIHGVLTRAKLYPEDTNQNRWQIVDIMTQNIPQIIGREDNNDWIMASALTVNFFWRGD